jgi:hypothetical protein
LLSEFLPILKRYYDVCGRKEYVSEEKDERGIQVSNKIVLEKVIFITQSPRPPLPQQQLFSTKKKGWNCSVDRKILSNIHVIQHLI